MAGLDGTAERLPHVRSEIVVHHKVPEVEGFLQMPLHASII